MEGGVARQDEPTAQATTQRGSARRFPRRRGRVVTRTTSASARTHQPRPGRQSLRAKATDDRRHDHRVAGERGHRHGHAGTHQGLGDEPVRIAAAVRPARTPSSASSRATVPPVAGGHSRHDAGVGECVGDEVERVERRARSPRAIHARATSASRRVSRAGARWDGRATARSPRCCGSRSHPSPRRRQREQQRQAGERHAVSEELRRNTFPRIGRRNAFLSPRVILRAR